MAVSQSVQPRGSYASLLQALRPTEAQPREHKRRKLGHPNTEDVAEKGSVVEEGSSTVAEESLDGDSKEDAEGLDAEDEDVADVDEQSDDEELADPFQQHLALPTTSEIQAQVDRARDSKATPTSKTVYGDLRRTWMPLGDDPDPTFALRKVADMHLKNRLTTQAPQLLNRLSPTERDIGRSIFSYSDVLLGNRTVGNISNLRDICALHSLNHILKTRDRVLRNTAKLAQNDDGELELRDQGFTRPKVLVVLPTKQSCVRFVDSIVKYSETGQQENKARFLETFSREDTEEWLEKPEDFRELFGGNHEEDFRIGLKFTRKSVKYFSGFYNSDIIICSPLGLFRTISSGASKDGKKAPDADFLSSIEIMIIDHASSLQMQNWQHVDFILDHLNALPKESHGCDFSRVRSWYLDDKAKYLRQTIILSSYLTPEINRLAAKHLHNIAGRVKYTPTYNGVMADVPNMLPIPVSQTFVRFDSRVPVQDSDARFRYFCASVLPQLARDKHSKGILVFVPTYADFTRLRNHLTNSSDSTSVPFGSVSEYTSVKDTTRARSHFLSGRNRVLLYTERAHHHFRYRLKGVRRVIFYGLPENPVFWSELVGLLGINRDLIEGEVAGGRGLVRAMFSKWDALKLERVVGTERVGRMVSERSGDTFDFV